MTPWWRRWVGRGAAAVAALASATACSRWLDYPEVGAESDAAQCANGLDDDFDGRIDCQDPDCQRFCTELRCDDGTDDDHDGDVDCRDPDCGCVDLLFVVDNSADMAEAQQLLAASVDDLGPLLAAAGSIHAGVVTTSLGSYGVGNCAPSNITYVADKDDEAHLLGTLERGRAASPTYDGRGYLAWDPRATLSPAGESDAGAFLDALRSQVRAAGDAGCGYERPLDALYRFLAEAEPRSTIDGAPDEVVLQQRAEFVRPGAVLGVLLLGTEDDCSMQQAYAQFVADSSLALPRASAACATNPNDSCCYSCSMPRAHDWCADPDPACALGVNLTTEEDPANLRCFDQKRRFAVDLLQPIDRYVDMLTKAQLQDPARGLVANPLAAIGPRRIVVGGILGVPWQDIASAASWSEEQRLDLLQGDEFAADRRWAVVLGDLPQGIWPTDPLMWPARAPRSGANPLTGDALVAPGTTGWNPINGRERSSSDTLEYACIFPMAIPRDCSASVGGLSQYCECAEPSDSPLCADPTTRGPPTTMFALGLNPTPRQLTVLQALGDDAIVASGCAKDVTHPERATYGYRAAMGAFAARVREALTLPPRSLSAE